MVRTRLLLVVATTATATVVTLTTGTVAAGRPAGTTAAQTEQQATAPSIDWGRCRDRFLRRAGAQCGFVTVPLDHDNPSGRKLRLAVSRVRHTTSTSQGVMLINPGGPGGPGLDLAALGRAMPRRSGAGYDWIGFDPRGVGASKPALSCQPNYFHGDRPPYVPSTRAILGAWLERSERYARTCGDKYGDLLEHLKTTDTVKDMDLIRQALGADTINFYGYSYGTYLGQVYATMFPDRIRRMVLDSNVDPTKNLDQWGYDQTLAFQRSFDIFFRWVARHRRTYRLGASGAAVEQLYLKHRRALQGRPANGVLGPSEWDDAFVPAGYVEPFWPVVASAFAAWEHDRNPRPLIQIWRLVDRPGDDNVYAVFNAVTCSDAPSTTDPRAVVATAWRLHKVAPVPTWGSTWYSAPCMFWPAEPGTLTSVRNDRVSPLLFGQTLDGATPFANSLAVRAILPASRLVAIRGGTTHGSTPDLAGPCAQARLAAYLKTGALPPRKPGRRADVACAAPPPPKPSADAQRGSASARDLLRRQAVSLP